MIKRRLKLRNYLSCLLAFGLCATLQLPAQQRGGGGGFGGGGFGGGGFGGGGGARSTAGSSTRNYNNNGTVGEAMIQVDPETRRLIVITDEETGQYVGQVITNLDRPKPQVLIKVVFVEVTRNDSLDFGIEGSYNKSFGSSWLGGLTTNFTVAGSNIVPSSITPTRNSSTFGGSNIFGLGALGAGQNGAGLYSLMGQEYQVTLRAIAQAGRMEVLSRPSILARNNQPATITVGQSVPLITSTTYSALNNLPISSYSYTSVGIILRVTPFINSDNMVEMIVAPQISELADRSLWVQTAPGVFAPVIDTRSADTVVVTPDGQTVIIGGLMRKAKMQADSKIPILGDIPILGNLFKHKIRSDEKTELLIFLTPHIVMYPSQLAGLTASERGKADMSPKAFTQDELDRFIDDLPPKRPPADGKAPKKKLNSPEKQ